ncbi:hypothetical protein LIT25_21385 [Bacillus sp. F19]|nr:hypothetical protein LIT25_21385 [Bacillus sp. F19]
MKLLTRLNYSDQLAIRKFCAIIKENFYSKSSPIGIEVDLSNADYEGKVMVANEDSLEIYSYTAKPTEDQHQLEMDISREVVNLNSIVRMNVEYNNVYYSSRIKAVRATIFFEDREIIISPYNNGDYVVHSREHIEDDFQAILSYFETVIVIRKSVKGA